MRLHVRLGAIAALLVMSGGASLQQISSAHAQYGHVWASRAAPGIANLDPGCPATWQCADVGAPVTAGSQTSGYYQTQIEGAGSGLQGTTDQFHFLARPVTGDIALSAGVALTSAPTSRTEAGLLVRANMQGNSAYYGVVLVGGQRVEVQSRTAASAPTTTLTDIATAPAPYLKVTRSGDTFTAYTSADGRNWVGLPGSIATVPLSAGTNAGMIVASGSPDTLAGVTFTDPQVVASSTGSNVFPTAGTAPLTVPTPIATSIPTATPTNTPVATSTPTATATNTPTATSTPVVTATSTPKPTASPTSTPTKTPTPTSTPLAKPSSTPTPTATPLPAPITSSAGIALGAYVNDGGLMAPCDTAAISQYTTMAGRAPAILMWYQEWGETYNSWPNRCAANARASGAIPMITWEPWAGSNPDPRYKLSNITRGDFDGYIRQWAQGAKAWGHPFFLRFAHEMNGKWYPWGTAAGNPEGNTAADYVAAWRHVHDLFVQVGATNAIWVWSPNANYWGTAPFTADYPGDSSVDWIGIDGYNVGTSSGFAGWLSLSKEIATTYSTLSGLTTRPMMIAETASTESGGNKAGWITQAFLNDIPTLYPRIHAVVWFDRNKETDWRVNSSAASLSAWRSVVASPLYQGSISDTGTVTSVGNAGNLIPSTSSSSAPVAPATSSPTAAPTPVASAPPQAPGGRTAPGRGHANAPLAPF
jgi:hypothetical protein